MSFQNRVIAITGAASGIGLATAHLLASHSATLCLADINDSALAAAQASILEKHPAVMVHTYTLDVRSESSVTAWLAAITSTFGALHGAANLAGVIGKSIGVSGIAELDVDEWDFVVGVNLRGVMLCLKHELRHIADGGSIVNASSIAGVMGMRNNAAYTASKHGVIGLTRSAAKEVGGKGVRVNAICPGYIDTPMNAQSKEIQEKGGNKEARDKTIRSVALGRSGKAEECADVIVYLLGDGASFITGNAVSVDGGWNC